MSRVKWSAAAVAVAVIGAGVAVAAEAVKADLKTFKWKAAFEGGADLGGYDEEKGRFFLDTNGSATGDITIPEDGEYTITVEASCDEALNEKAKFKLTVGDEVVAKEFELKQTGEKAYPCPAKLKKGDAKLVIEFLNDAYKENEYDRNLYVHAVKVEPTKAK